MTNHVVYFIRKNEIYQLGHNPSILTEEMFRLDGTR